MPARLTSRACWQSHENRSREDSMKAGDGRPGSEAGTRVKHGAGPQRGRARLRVALRRCGAINQGNSNRRSRSLEAELWRSGTVPWRLAQGA